MAEKSKVVHRLSVAVGKRVAKDGDLDLPWSSHQARAPTPRPSQHPKIGLAPHPSPHMPPASALIPTELASCGPAGLQVEV